MLIFSRITLLVIQRYENREVGFDIYVHVIIYIYKNTQRKNK